MTNVKAPVLATINNMKADGYTHVAEGVGWGLRVISPGAPFTEGVDYSDEDITKAMVLLTDGENTFDTEDNHNGQRTRPMVFWIRPALDPAITGQLSVNKTICWPKPVTMSKRLAW